MSAALLVANAGSTSLKLAVYELAERAGRLDLRIRARAEGFGDRPRWTLETRDGVRRAGDLPPGAGHEAAFARLLPLIEEALDGVAPVAAGHRVVHGGGLFTEPVRITPEVLAELARLAPLAPKHQPHNLAAIRALAAARPGLLQVACFDTAFHARQSWSARQTGLPRSFAERGLLRYGFHGLSYQSVVERFAAVTGTPLPERLVIAHLGGGCSLCAVRAGTSVATTMGFSPLDGVPMATRSGSVDPGLLIHLLREEGMSVEELDALLNHRSGLLGMSGISGDMRQLLASDDPRAAEAVDWFCERVHQALAAMAAALGGLDGLVFTGGIGEGAAPVRARILTLAAWLGFALDEAANARGGPTLTLPESRLRAWVVPSDEEGVIARAVAPWLG